MKSPCDNNSQHFFRGDPPDDEVPMVTLDDIRAITKEFDADRLEVMVIETGGDPGYYVTALVFLNKGRDDGYYFRGLADLEGYHILYPRAKDVVDALKTIADEKRMQLDIWASGDGLKLSCEPDNFFQQLKDEQVGWMKNDEPKSADPSCIPAGSHCAGCPYVQTIPGKPDQNDGYCAYLDFGDWMTKLGFSMLWDGLKKCQINRD